MRIPGLELPRRIDLGHWTAPLSLMAVGYVLVLDDVINLKEGRFLVRAIGDESAHAATTWVLLASVQDAFDPVLLAATVVGSSILDLDHVPMLLGWQALTPDEGRPYLHSLISPTVVAVASQRLPGRSRQIARRLALGMCSHLLRDLATGEAYIAWPLSDHEVHLPYAGYVSALLVAASVTTLRAVSRH